MRKGEDKGGRIRLRWEKVRGEDRWGRERKKTLVGGRGKAGKGKSRKGLVEDNLKHNFGDNSVIF